MTTVAERVVVATESCPDCGGSLVEGARFCSFCGKRLGRQQELEEQAAPQQVDEPIVELREATPEDEESLGGDRDVIKKICVIGDSGVGKKTIVGRIAPFHQDVLRYTETIGTAVTKYLLTYEQLRLLIIVWDITGKAEFQHLKEPYYRGAEGLVVMVDASDPESVAGVTNWIEDAYAITGPIPTVVVGTKVDLVPQDERRAVDAELRAALGRHDKVPIYYVSSGADLTAIKEPFFYVAERLRLRFLDQIKGGQLRRMEHLPG